MSDGGKTETFTMKVNMTELRQYVGEFIDESRRAMRPAAQAGAQVLYDDVKRNVARMGRKTGNLAKSIYQVYSKDNSGPNEATYHVSWNHIKAPHGRLLEWGHIQTHVIYFDEKTGRFVTDMTRPLAQPRQIGARPFIRPAIAKFPQAEAAIRERFFEELLAKGLVT